MPTFLMRERCLVLVAVWTAHAALRPIGIWALGCASGVSTTTPAEPLATRPCKIPESVLVVIHTPDLQVLMLERTDRPGFWQCVIGSKDALDEPIAETARREVQEKTGIEASQGQLRDWGLANEYEIYPVWRRRYAPGVTRNIEHVFGLTVPAGTAVRLAPREHLQYCWLPLRGAADLCSRGPMPRRCCNFSSPVGLFCSQVASSRR